MKRVPALQADFDATTVALEEPDVLQRIWFALYKTVEALKREQPKRLRDDIAFNRGSLKPTTGSAHVRQNKRKRAAAAAAASSAAESVAVLSATAVAQKRTRIIDSDEDDEDDEDDEGKAGEGGAAVGAVQSGSSRKRARRDSFSEDENPFVGDGFD